MRARTIVCLLGGTLSFGACGHVTAPVPPDDFGIGIRVQAEKKKDEQALKEQKAREAAAQQQAEGGVPAQPDEMTLPEMRPVGGR